MNGVHDLGGMHGFGRINAEPESVEPVFHAEWERRVFGLFLAAGACRFTIFQRSPATKVARSSRTVGGPRLRFGRTPVEVGLFHLVRVVGASHRSPRSLSKAEFTWPGASSCLQAVCLQASEFEAQGDNQKKEPTEGMVER